MTFELTQSPQTQAMQGGPAQGASAEDIFRDGFRSMAYAQLMKSHPELARESVSFKVLSVDPERGMGVGTFIIQHDQEVLYVPAVIADNALKPLDLMYAKRQDRFWPLTPEYLRKASEGALTSMGSAVEPPKTMAPDVDLTNLVRPPMAGRYSYAADRDAEAAVVAAFRKVASEDRGLLLPSLLARAPEAVREGVRRAMVKHASVRAQMIRHYGKAGLAEMLAPRPATKRAAETEVAMRGDARVLDGSTPMAELKSVAGDDAPRALELIRTSGFYLKDRRPTTNNLFELSETRLGLTEPTDPGIYRVYLRDGGIEEALVVPNPYEFAVRPSDMTIAGNNADTQQASRPRRNRFLVIFADRRYALLTQLVAEPVMARSHEDVEAFVRDLASEAPGNGENGSFVSTARVTAQATVPERARDVTSGADEVRATMGWWSDVGVIHSRRMTGTRIVRPVGSAVQAVPSSFRWVRLRDTPLRESDVLTSPEMILRRVEAALLKEGAKPVSVKRAGMKFRVGGGYDLLGLGPALQKTANAYGLRLGDALVAIKEAAAGRVRHLYAAPFRATKLAVDEGGGSKKAPPGGDAETEEGAVDPAAAAAMAQPPPPTGLDLAVAEQTQQLQMQIQALQQQIQALQTVQMRAQQIDAGGGAMAAPMGAAAMMGGAPPPVGGMPPQDPSMMGGMDPSMMQDPSMGGMDPSMMQDPAMMGGADPSMGGMPAGPMDAGMTDAGMDPGMPESAPPMAMMTDEQLTPENVTASINPQFLDQADALNADGVFDAAVVASLARQKGVGDLATALVPNLEKALDNLGRLRLQLAIKEPEHKETLGNDAYLKVEQSLRDTFHGLGEAIAHIDRMGNTPQTP